MEEELSIVVLKRISMENNYSGNRNFKNRSRSKNVDLYYFMYTISTIESFVRVSSFFPAIEHLIQRVKGLYVLSLLALLQCFPGKPVWNYDRKRQATTKADLSVEKAYCLSGTHTQFPENTLGLFLGLGFNSGVNYC